MISIPTLEKELARCVASLEKHEPGSEQYHGVIHSITELRYTIRDLKEGSNAFVITPAPAQIDIPETPDECKSEEPEVPTGEKNVEEPEAPTYKKEEVRAALGKARAEKGLNVVEYLKTKYRVDNFTALPAGRYAEVMADLAKMGKS